MEKFLVSSQERFSIEDLIYLKSKNITKISDESNFNRYLKSINVFKKIKNCQISKNKNQKPTLSKRIYNYLYNSPSYYSRYVPLVLLGQDHLNRNDVTTKIKNLNLSHLFVISGFHINLIIMIINKILKCFRAKNIY